MTDFLPNADNEVNITYAFRFEDGRSVRISLRLHGATCELLPEQNAGKPEWTALEFHKCGHCPLAAERSPRCPFAQALATVIPPFEPFYSYEETTVEVVTPLRAIVSRGPLQNGMAALIGLIGATCGCPHLAFLRPMARFHLPFASEEETMYRAASTELLRQYLASEGNPGEALSLEGLRRNYENAVKVNLGMAERIRAGSTRDAAINGLIILDTFAQAAPYVIGGKLRELRHVFECAGSEG